MSVSSISSVSVKGAVSGAKSGGSSPTKIVKKSAGGSAGGEVTSSVQKSVPGEVTGKSGASKHLGSKKNNIVEFRFYCPYDLRQQMNDRLKDLKLERGPVMVGFLEEWLKQTEQHV